MTSIHPAAKLELEEATLYYTQISPALAVRFLDDFEETLSFIESMPAAWAIYFLNFRKLNFKIFPYSIIYDFSESNHELSIIAVQHHNRKPFYWKGRK